MLFYPAVSNDAFFGTRIGPESGDFFDDGTDHEVARSLARMPVRRGPGGRQARKSLKYRGKRRGPARPVCSAAM
jgi:hypothetical protein